MCLYFQITNQPQKKKKRKFDGVGKKRMKTWLGRKEEKWKLDGVGKKTEIRKMKTWWGRKEDSKKKNENLMGLERKEWKLD